MEIFCERTGFFIVKNWGEKRVLKVVKISPEKCISKVQEKQRACMVNKTKICIEITPLQIGIEAQWLEAYKMQMKNELKKRNYYHIEVGKYVGNSYR